jgi:predicted GTPase
MKNSEGLKSFQQSLSGLPQWVSERILQQINQLTDYEPVIGIMGKTGAGKSSLCNALFAGEVSPVSDVAACTREPLRFRLQVGDRYMTVVDCPAWAKVALAIPSMLRCTANNFPGSTWFCG